VAVKETDEERKKRLRKERKAKKEGADLDEIAVDDSSRALFAKRARTGGDFSNF